MFDLVQEDMNDDYIPIFKSGARRTLREKSAVAVQDLLALHQSLTSSDPSYDGGFNKATAEEAFHQTAQSDFQALSSAGTITSPSSTGIHLAHLTHPSRYC